MQVRSCTSRRSANPANSSRISSKRLLAVADEVHLVDAEHEVADAEQRGDRGVPARLLGGAVAGVDEEQDEVGGRAARHHVAGVLGVAGGVGDDELAFRRGEVAVGDVDRDALLALGPQPVGQQRQVHVLVAPGEARALDGFELVLEDLLRVVEQPADQRGLAVVDRAGGREAQQLH